ncbi:hypothetical protein SMICM304S_07405 [Streptomyces microflavus]
MELALRRTYEAPGDPLSEPLAAYLAEHIQEEQGHDAWLLEDLLVAGAHSPGTRSTRCRRRTWPPWSAPEYYWIEHHHPVALLGYIAVLEGYAPAPGLTDRIAGTTGLPPPPCGPYGSTRRSTRTTWTSCTRCWTGCR